MSDLKTNALYLATLMKKYANFAFYNTAIFSEVSTGLSFEIMISRNNYKMVMKTIKNRNIAISGNAVAQIASKMRTMKNVGKIRRYRH